MTHEPEFDVVISALQERKDKLWHMTMHNEQWGAMDHIRLEQIQELNEAMGMWLLWKEEKNDNSTLRSS